MKDFKTFITEKSKEDRIKLVDLRDPHLPFWEFRRYVHHGSVGSVNFRRRLLTILFKPTPEDRRHFGNQLKNDQRECVFRIYRRDDIKKESSFVKVDWKTALVFFVDSEAMRDQDTTIVWDRKGVQALSIVVDENFVNYKK